MTTSQKQKTEVLWKPNAGPQTYALQRNEFEILYGGARGGGKTDAGLAFLSRWTKHPQFRALVVRKNADDLKDWTDRGRKMYAGLGGITVGSPAHIRFPSGAKILTGHLKDENAYTKYQGHEYQKMVIEELTQIPREEDYLKLISSCRSTISELVPQVFATTNPGGAGHNWVRKRFRISGVPMLPVFTEDEISKRTRIFIPAKVDDNPILMQKDPTYINFLDSLPTALRKAWREGNWDIFAGQYFEEWNTERHTVMPFPIPETWRKFRAYDYGRENPACCLWFALDYDGRVWVYREFYLGGLDADQQAIEILRMSGEEQYDYSVADPSIFARTGIVDKHGGETIAQTFVRHGITFFPASNRRVDGWNMMHQYLRFDKENAPKILFFNICHNTIRTIPTLLHNERKPEDMSTKGEDHAADVVRYFLMSLHESKTKVPVTGVEKKLLEMKQRKESLSNFYYGTTDNAINQNRP